MARMYGAYSRPCCSQCRSFASRTNSPHRSRERRQWQRDWDDDLDHAYWERWNLELLGAMIALVWDGDARSYLEHYYDAVPAWGSPPYAVR